PTYLIILLGTNDLDRNVNLAIFSKNYEQIISDVVKKSPETKILTVGLLVRKDFTKDQVEMYSTIIQDLAEKYNVDFVDPYTWLTQNDLQDDVHPTINVQQTLADHFSGIIQNMETK
ncbi:MAG: SGNH/GDSL hydrolase family protein, partial [Candidatus Levyibacteriota bacterium]